MGDRVMEIMKLIPMGKDYLWGGTRLREEYGKKKEILIKKISDIIDELYISDTNMTQKKLK